MNEKRNMTPHSTHGQCLRHAERLCTVVFVAALLLALVGCGGGGGRNEDNSIAEPLPPLPTEADPCEGIPLEERTAPGTGVVPAGFYTGVFVDCTTGDAHFPYLLLDRDGAFQLAELKGDEWGANTETPIYVHGSLGAHDGRSQGSGRWYVAPGVAGDLMLEVVGLNGDYYEGYWGNEWGSRGYFRLLVQESATRLYEWPEAWQSLPLGSGWTGTDYLSDADSDWTVAADGYLEGIDTNGCLYSGQAVQSDPGYNLFNVEITVTGCVRAGTYAGLGRVNRWTDGPDYQGWDLVLVLGDGEARWLYFIISYS